MRSMTFVVREASVAMDGEDARRTRWLLVDVEGMPRSEKQGDAVPADERLDSDEPRSDI